ncbi:glycosyltransferase family 4 protein [Conexibacter woesei]|uniref:Glycosyl transferase group 1 n=1 Tax=Conexibacter woesei (strain DSM 14684 / CCUG 47730 / CIP 108061 / JCM 11494 / NBRC 100937 / ID131577) TaxID=469383 RepID=D3EZQ3_CONWI|nr:glycosyltransferase family 4 protein [Conexibacter woesei]ADB53891.1 glycosyl transferase group 1 [Conexibacter woesei DSM 14684]
MTPRPLLPRIVRRLRGGAPPVDESPFTALAAVAELLRGSPAPLAAGAGAAAERDRLDVAVVIPWYPRGSGGHQTIFNVVRGLEARGHRCSIWLDDPTGRHAALDEAAVARELHAQFGACAGPVHKGFARWSGADVVVATSWPTAYRVALLGGCRGRAYLVQDHEPEFYPTSAEREWAAATYGLGLHCIAASRWLAELLRERHGAPATHFDLGIDHARYTVRPQVARSDRRVLFYARVSTARRAIPLGLLALDELQRRRPDVELALFGSPTPVPAPFRAEQLGLLTPSQLADAYARATVGMVLSLTNPSLVPQEMLACGLPCVDVERPSTRSEWGSGGGVELARFDPIALADALERLLEDRSLRAQRSEAGVAWARDRTWAHAAEQVEQGLRTALRAAA